MKKSKVKNINKRIGKTYDITVSDNHNFFCNGHLIHNCDYRGDIGVILINLGQEYFHVEAGDRIAQLIFENVGTISQFETVEDLDDTTRGEGGYGHTGK